eukprot:TRINITY_DN16842_c0_g1_i2.p1 TRINITY_DN16842_c0_g1~~TRINITY_DN16842_c0_g1_i2.p1  ORF type:complete len:341 (+),score=51.16 TRINITY_DN16842_c0_g1_i2:55-1077(+)
MDSTTSSSGDDKEPLFEQLNTKLRGRCNVKICWLCCSLTLLCPLLAFIICAARQIKSQVSPAVVDELLGGKWRLLAEDMPRQPSPDAVKDAVAKLSDDPWKNVPAASESTHSWGSASAATAAHLMYNITKVEGIWDKVPEKLRGVFWMQGNGVAEELAVLQYGLWSEQSLQYLVPMAPFTWAWPAGKPAHAPNGGFLYSDLNLTYTSAVALTKGQRGDTAAPIAFSYTWSAADLTFARLQAHDGDNLHRDVINVKDMTGFGPKWATGRFTLEEEVPGGVQWNRGIKWGVGSCPCFEFGSYTLVKIIDGNGFPVQPHYDSFIKYMGNIPLILWTGRRNNSE